MVTMPMALRPLINSVKAGIGSARKKRLKTNNIKITQNFQL